MESNKFLGLLRWSLQYTDGTKPSDAKAMDPKTREWLKEAIESQTVDPMDQMKTLVKVICLPRMEPDEELQVEKEGNEEATEETEKATKTETEINGKKADEKDSKEKTIQAAKELGNDFVDQKVKALELLEEWVEQIDWAADLHKIGGFKPVIECCTNSEERIRIAALQVVATVVQNNPKCQEYATELNLLPMLIERIKTPNLSELEYSKIILATSCMIRENSKGTVAFIKDHKGVAILMEVIKSKEKGLKPRRKALFLMRYILNTVPAIRVVLCDQLTQVLNEGMLDQDIDLRENCLHLLISLFGDSNVSTRISGNLREVTKENLQKFENGESHFEDLDEISVELSKKLKEMVLTVVIKPDETQQDEPKLLKM